MLKFLRKGATSTYVKILLGIIVIVFIFWGIGNFAWQNKNLVAKVNGIPITLKEFQQDYNFQVARLKQIFGELSSEELKKFRLKEEVLEDLVKIKLLENEAEKLDIHITPAEISYAISQIHSFQENSRFNPQKYQYMLHELGITPEFFETLIKSDIIQQRLKLFLTLPILVSEDEVREYIKYTKQNLEILEVDLPLKVCQKRIKFTEEDLKNYYLAHRDLYKEKEKVKLAYYFIPYDEKIKVTEKEIERYYRENLDRFKQPFKVKLRRIFVSGTDEEAFKKAQNIKNKLKSISDFAKYGDKRGEWFEESAFPQILRTILKSAKKEDIIGPLKISSGYLILGVEDIKPEKIPKLEEVKTEIYKFLKKKKMKEKAREKAHKVYEEIIKEGNLSLWAKKKKINLKKTPWLTKEELIKKFDDFHFAKKVFSSLKGEYFPPIETSEGVYLTEIRDKQPERLLPFEKVKNQVKRDYLRDKGKELCEKRMQEVIKKLKNKKEIYKKDFPKDFLLKEYRIKRYELFQNFSPVISQILINTGSVGLIESPLWDRETLKLFYIKKIIPSEEKIKPEEISTTFRELLKEKREAWFNNWYQSLRKEAKIKIYPIYKKL